MRRLLKLAALPAADRRLLLAAGLLVGGIRVSLLLFPYPTVQRLLARASAPKHPADPAPEVVDRVAWAATTASRHLAGKRPCLPQALAAQLMLARRGHASEVKIGVARKTEGGIQAHAWLMCDGRMVVGEDTRETWVPMRSTDAPGEALPAPRSQ